MEIWICWWRNLKHLFSKVDDLSKCNIGFKVLSGQGADIDTVRQHLREKWCLEIFATLAKFERELIRKGTVAGIQVARDRGRMGGKNIISLNLN
jgi:DNA invertase Pin-like site-specific DNA recombinase